MQNSYNITLFSAPQPLLSEIWENRRGEKTDSSRELCALTPCPVTDKLGGKGREEGGGNNVLKLGVSYLNSLSSLLSICQELNGESPGILEGILEVDKAVTHMSSHGTFPTYGDRTRITVEMQYLEENKTVSLFNKELKRNSAMMKKSNTSTTKKMARGSSNRQRLHNSFSTEEGLSPPSKLQIIL